MTSWHPLRTPRYAREWASNHAVIQNRAICRDTIKRIRYCRRWGDAEHGWIKAFKNDWRLYREAMQLRAHHRRAKRDNEAARDMFKNLGAE